MRKSFIIPFLFCAFVVMGQSSSNNIRKNAQAGSPSVTENTLSENFPLPGSVFREYVWTPGSDYGPVRKEEPSQYVSSLTATGRAAFWLPNGRNRVFITDLAGATRAEVLAEVWHALEGLTAKTIRVNSNPWINLQEPPIPDERGTETDLSTYRYHSYVYAPVPLSYLKPTNGFTSSNIFECDAYGGKYPLYKIYGVTWRIHYGQEKPHVEAVIATPANGAVVGDYPVFSIRPVPGERAIRRVDYIGYYEDFNYKGHGPNRDWQFRRSQGQLTYHIGSTTVAPFSVTWDTKWIPDQLEPMKFVAIITDEEGFSYTTPVVEGIKFSRPDRSVKLYKAYDVPPNFTGRNASSNKVNITDDPHEGSAAQMFISSWCGAGANGIMVNGNLLIDKVGTIGHKYQLDLLDVPVGYLNKGVNVLGLNKYSGSMHGIEVMWPGMEMKVIYESLRKDEK